MTKKKAINSYKDIIEIPNNLKQELPTAFDIVGDILLIKLRGELIQYKNEIADALLKSQKNVKTVCLTHPVTGEIRTRKLEIIGGEKKTVTTHKEYGLNFAVDVEKVYFSSRLANERKRISELVKKDEIIVDMFAGVAPFSIMIAKYADPKIIFAFDINKDAIKYAKENIKKNNVLDKVEAVYSDTKYASEYLAKKNVKADRVIMNLPFSAYKFFSIALQIMSDKCIINYFEIISEDGLEKRLNDLKKIANNHNIEIETSKVRKIKSYSPREFYIGIDITAKRKTGADVA